jgi:hypothetical protein
VPVTISLSQKLYERFGEDVTRELVDWFNTVDSSYREELRRHNDLNFARFEAKLAQGLAEVKGDIETKLADLKTDLLKWMFGFWATTTLALVALALRK